MICFSPGSSLRSTEVVVPLAAVFGIAVWVYQFGALDWLPGGPGNNPFTSPSRGGFYWAAPRVHLHHHHPAWPWTMMSSSLPESLSSAKRATAADPKKWPQRLSSFYNYSGSSLQLPQTPLPSALICLRSNMIWFEQINSCRCLNTKVWRTTVLLAVLTMFVVFCIWWIWWVSWPTSLVSGNPAAVRGGLTLTGPRSLQPDSSWQLPLEGFFSATWKTWTSFLWPLQDLAHSKRM